MTVVKCLHIFGWTTPLSGTSAFQSDLWPLHVLLIKFATGVRHQQGGVCEDRVRTRRAAQRWVHVSLCVRYCVETRVLNTCVCVFSGPVSWPVLSLRRGGTERWVFVTRRELREELWKLLMECGRHGRDLPTYCRFPYYSATPPPPPPPPPSSSCSSCPFMYNSLLLC